MKVISSSNHLKVSLLANYGGQIYAIIISLAFIPLYINYLGIEAYGIVGFYTFLNSSLVLLDLGLRAALGRETVRVDIDKNYNNYRDLLRSIEIVFITLSFIIVIIFFASSNWFAENWFSYKELGLSEVSTSIKIISLVTLLRFIEGIYTSVIIGQQRHINLNILLTSFSTVKAIGSIFVLNFISSDLISFFTFHALVGLISLFSYRYSAFSKIRSSSKRVEFSWSELNKIKRFALGVAAASSMGVIVANTDKAILSTILPLSEYAVYILASTVATILLTLTAPLNQTWLPKMTNLVFDRQANQLIDVFHLGAQMLTYIVGSISILLILFGDIILQIWLQDEGLAKKVWPIVCILTVANYFGAMARYIGQASYAHGQTKIVLIFNVAALLIIIPMMIIVTPEYGVIGAAWVWLINSGGTLFIGCPFIFKNILKDEYWRWYIYDSFIPLAFSFLISLIIRKSISFPASNIEQILLLILIAIIIQIIMISLLPSLRKHILNKIKLNYG